MQIFLRKHKYRAFPIIDNTRTTTKAKTRVNTRFASSEAFDNNLNFQKKVSGTKVKTTVMMLNAHVLLFFRSLIISEHLFYVGIVANLVTKIVLRPKRLRI